ncbi:MAG TPA: tripartite tricarboxylate transporter substrate binding protein [Xanthobacteraceae bacterium]|jgi:tripartite-type tricarboxylate transporter receptor subunit TctC
MKLIRRKFLAVAVGAAAGPIVCRSALALDYPTRPVRLIEGYGAGGTPDIVSRLIAQWLSQRLKQPFIVENRNGASGNIATEAVAKAVPDGYTLLTCASANPINAALYTRLNFNFIRDIAPVAGLVRVPLVLLVNPSFPAATFPAFIAYAKAHPGKINLATPGTGTPMHVAADLLKMMTGVDIVEVPYHGPAPAYTDLLAGQVQAFIITVPSAIGFIRSGKLRGLAVLSAARLKVLSDTPTINEFVPGYEAWAWDGIGAPAKTPMAIIDKLNKSINDGLADPQIKARLDDLGGEPMPMTPVEFGRFIAAETAKWAKVVKFSGARAD